MTEDRLCASDGVTVVPLTAGEAYDLPDELAERYVASGLATPSGYLVGEKGPELFVKDAGDSAEDKQSEPAPANKQRPSRRRRSTKPEPAGGDN